MAADGDRARMGDEGGETTVLGAEIRVVGQEVPGVGEGLVLLNPGHGLMV